LGQENCIDFFNSILFDGKVNLVDALEGLSFKIPNSFQSNGKNKNKNERIMGILLKIVLDFGFFL